MAYFPANWYTMKKNAYAFQKGLTIFLKKLPTERFATFNSIGRFLACFQMYAILLLQLIDTASRLLALRDSNTFDEHPCRTHARLLLL